MKPLAIILIFTTMIVVAYLAVKISKWGISYIDKLEKGKFRSNKK